MANKQTFSVPPLPVAADRKESGVYEFRPNPVWLLLNWQGFTLLAALAATGHACIEASITKEQVENLVQRLKEQGYTEARILD